MKKFLITAELKDLEQQYAKGEITYSRMVEILNEKAFAFYSHSAINLRKEWCMSKGYNFMEFESIAEAEEYVLFLESRLTFSDDQFQEENNSLLERVHLGLERELKRQKVAGKKFISDEDVDTLIDGIIKVELGPDYKEKY